LYLDFSFLVNAASVSHIKNSLTMFILRGLPGSGKSTVVRKLKEVYPEASVCSADEYFLSMGVYEYDKTKLKDAHVFSQNKAEEQCKSLVNTVIVDNTNVKKWEIVPYLKIASSKGYTVVIVEPKTPWKFDPDELVTKNLHNVSRSKIEARLKDWHRITPYYYGWFLNPADSMLLLELSSSWFRKCIAFQEFFDDFSVYSNRFNERSMLNYFSSSNTVVPKLHVTAHFIKKSKNSFGDSEPSENEFLGSASNLRITGLIITPKTFGARVKLSDEQLVLYKQNDREIEIPTVTSKNENQRPFKKPQGVDEENLTQVSIPEIVSACKTSLTTEPSVMEEYDPNNEPIFGRRAHITLGCAEGIRPVQTGLDQLSVLSEEPIGSFKLEGATLLNFGNGRWMVNFERAVNVNSLFSGAY